MMAEHFEAVDTGLLVIGNPTNSRFAFYLDDQEVMAFGSGGSITVNPDIRADAAAKAVIDCLRSMWPAALTEARAQGAADERERLAKLADDNALDPDALDPDVGTWIDIATWLRSQKDN
jgi:hypothetical protein